MDTTDDIDFTEDEIKALQHLEVLHALARLPARPARFLAPARGGGVPGDPGQRRGRRMNKSAQRTGDALRPSRWRP